MLVKSVLCFCYVVSDFSQSVVAAVVLICIFRLHRSTVYMWPIVTDGVAWSMGLSVTVVSPAKMAEPIKVPCGVCTPVAKETMY